MAGEHFRAGDYNPWVIQRFFRSPFSQNGLPDNNFTDYETSQRIGAYAATPNPNFVPMPYLHTPEAYYNLPNGPTRPVDLLHQREPPPQHNPLWYGLPYPPTQYPPTPRAPGGPGGPGAPGGPGGAGGQGGAGGPGGPGGPGGGGGGGGGGSGELVGRLMPPPPPGINPWVAQQKLIPEMVEQISRKLSHSQAGLIRPAPANVAPPVRSYGFKQCVQSPIAITDGVFTDVVTYRVPRGTNGVAVELGQELESLAAFADVQWRVVVDELPVPQLSDIRCQLGALAVPATVNIKAIEDQTIRVQASSLTLGAVHFARASLGGWAFVPTGSGRMNNLESYHQGWSGY